jgi:hypothetical protein
VPTITGCPTSVRRGRTYTLSGRQMNGLTQCVYYGNDATQATNYPIVRLESTTSSNVYYCRTSGYSTMGLQTGTIIHTCNFTVPASVPLGTYCLRVIANGISSACRTVGVTNKWFKELKYEIKEKFEIIENLKQIRDINVKRLPDIDDIKLIREDIDFGIFERIQEDWVKTIRTLALNADQANEELSRTFIVPDERPIVGPPPPIIEKLNVPRISAEEARRSQEKRAFNDGRKELAVSREAEELHKLIHSLYKSGGKVDVTGSVTRARTSRTRATKATARKTPPRRTKR